MTSGDTSSATLLLARLAPEVVGARHDLPTVGHAEAARA
jgi:hypothetical protein